jgi:radical SAM-linked protein
MRLRIKYSKSGPLVYVGTLDVLTIWERAARRAGLPLEYSLGFHPQPKMQLAAPLPLGFSSRCEILDMRLTHDVDSSGVAGRLQDALPAGLTILSIQDIDPASAAPGVLVQSVEYEVTFNAPTDSSKLAARIDQALSSSTLPRERRSKRYDLRPLIEGLRIARGVAEASPTLWMRLAARPGATGRPDEVLDELGYARDAARIERIALIPSL